MYHFVGIDLIQGVNWLSKNHAMIDFKEKNVYLSLENENEVNRLPFHSEEYAFHPNIISFVKATKYL